MEPRQVLIVRLIQRATADDNTATDLVAAIAAAAYDMSTAPLRDLLRQEQDIAAGDLAALSAIDLGP